MNDQIEIIIQNYIKIKCEQYVQINPIIVKSTEISISINNKSINEDEPEDYANDDDDDYI